MRSSNWRDMNSSPRATYHVREGDAVAFNEDGERWCDLR